MQTAMEELYSEINELRGNITKAEFSRSYLGASDGYMTTMQTMGRDASAKAIAHFITVLETELAACTMIHAQYSNSRTQRLLEKTTQLHVLAQKKLREMF